MSIDLINESNVGRVVMVDIIDLVTKTGSNDYGRDGTNWLERAIQSKLRDDKPATLLLSMLKLGFTIPILVSIKGDYYLRPTIENGHHRLCLALFAGFTEVPVLVSRNCDEWDNSEDESLPESNNSNNWKKYPKLSESLANV